jgi:hypothetical protein
MLWDKFLYKRASIACYKIIIIANGQKKCGWIRAFPLVIALIPLFFNKCVCAYATTHKCVCAYATTHKCVCAYATTHKCVCAYATTQIIVYNSRDIFTIEGNKDVK